MKLRFYLLIKPFLDAERRQRAVILAHLLEVKGVLPTLMKIRSGSTLDSTETELVRSALLSLRSLCPYLIVLALPGSVLLLPVLAYWLDRRRQRRLTLNGLIDTPLENED